MPPFSSLFFFFNDTATTEIYTLSLHDALPISVLLIVAAASIFGWLLTVTRVTDAVAARSEEHTSELQSHHDLVCRLLLEKKKKTPKLKKPQVQIENKRTGEMHRHRNGDLRHSS